MSNLAPRQRTIRTVFQALVALAAMLPLLVAETGLKFDQWPWLAGVLAICAVITRVMAMPPVEMFLQQYAPWLSAAGSTKGKRAARRNEAGAVVIGVVEVCLIVMTVVVVLWWFGYRP